MVEMVKKARDVVKSSPLTEWFDCFTFMPGITRKTLGLFRRDCPREEFFNATDDEIREYLRSTVGTTYVVVAGGRSRPCCAHSATQT